MPKFFGFFSQIGPALSSAAAFGASYGVGAAATFLVFAALGCARERGAGRATHAH